VPFRAQRSLDMYERDMAEATKSGQNAAKNIMTIIHKDFESSAAFDKAGSTRNAETGAVDNPIKDKMAKAGGAASDEAGSCRCKRKAVEHPATAGKAIKVAKRRETTGQVHTNAAAMNVEDLRKVGSGRDVAVQAAKVLGPFSASPTPHAEQLTATYKFLAGDFKRAIAAVETPGLQWTTRQQRAALRGATLEQRAVAYLLAERLFAAKMRRWAAIKLYWAERRKCVEYQKAVDDAGPHGMAYVNCTAIREGYTGVGKEEVAVADAAMAAASAAIRAIRSTAASESVVQEKGPFKTGAASARAPETGKGEAAAAASAGVSGMPMGKASPASAQGSRKGKGKAKAVEAPVEDDDADDVVIVKVILANPLATQVKAKAEQVKAKAEPASSLPTALASAAGKAGVLGYGYAEHDDSEWADS